MIADRDEPWRFRRGIDDHQFGDGELLGPQRFHEREDVIERRMSHHDHRRLRGDFGHARRVDRLAGVERVLRLADSPQQIAEPGGVECGLARLPAQREAQAVRKTRRRAPDDALQGAFRGRFHAAPSPAVFHGLAARGGNANA
ncbi:hypothetical protein [Paraburkholderia acidisoli]|uniref:hypothetical protein n=1 Tax=Paraburkholderia acidisoli TaxID=2571748 RepID=UPI001E4FA6C6|nr:hypothetical protein [Paraburkholderia acidisoli]